MQRILCGRLEDVSAVAKVVMPDEVYDKRADSFRSFKKTVLAEGLARSPVRSVAEMQQDASEAHETELLAHFKGAWQMWNARTRVPSSSLLNCGDPFRFSCHCSG